MASMMSDLSLQSSFVLGFFLPYSKNGRRQKLQVCDWWGSCTVAAKGNAGRCRRQVVELAVGCSKWHQSATEEKLVNESPRQ